jgi:hypothetical protein
MSVCPCGGVCRRTGACTHGASSSIPEPVVHVPGRHAGDSARRSGNGAARAGRPDSSRAAASSSISGPSSELAGGTGGRAARPRRRRTRRPHPGPGRVALGHRPARGPAHRRHLYSHRRQPPAAAGSRPAAERRPLNAGGRALARLVSGVEPSRDSLEEQLRTDLVRRPATRASSSSGPRRSSVSSPACWSSSRCWWSTVTSTTRSGAECPWRVPAGRWGPSPDRQDHRRPARFLS